MQPDDETVSRSLESATKFADKIVPLLADAFEHAVRQVRDVPPGGIADTTAQLQALPNLVRLNLIQLVHGANAIGGSAQIRRKGSPNNGLWLGLVGLDMMARVYKNPSKYPIRPSGIHQERLIRQERYRRLLLQPDLGFNLASPQLDALLLWHSNGFDLLSAFVVIPDGWDEQMRVIELARQSVPLPDTVGDLAQFEPLSEHITLLGGSMPILTEGYDSELADVRVGEEPGESPEEDDARFEGADEPLGDPADEEDGNKQ
jgi:hypothetical protein